MNKKWHTSVRIGRIVFRSLVGLFLIYIVLVFIYFNFFKSSIRKLEPGSMDGSASDVLAPAKPIKAGRLVRVLSIDGGGIRGLIPLTALKALEKRSGKPIYELFDVMTGTSTGGIIVISLTVPDDQGKPRWSAEYVTQAYEELSRRAFSVPFYHRVLGVNGIVGSIYSSGQFDAVINKYFKGYRISQLLSTVVLPSYDLLSNRPFLFRSRDLPGEKNKDFWLNTVVAAVTAAPVFFQPVEVVDVAGDMRMEVIDAGIFVNDPTRIGSTQSLDYYPDQRSIVVSLGAGTNKGYTGTRIASNWGLTRWSIQLYGVSINGRALLDVEILDDLTAMKDTSISLYLRLNTWVAPNMAYIGYRDEGQINTLHKLGQEMVESNTKEIDAIIKVLLDPTPSAVEKYRQEVGDMGDGIWSDD